MYTGEMRFQRAPLNKQKNKLNKANKTIKTTEKTNSSFP